MDHQTWLTLCWFLFDGYLSRRNSARQMAIRSLSPAPCLLEQDSRCLICDVHAFHV